MEAVLIRAGGFMLLIVLGFVLKRIGLFNARDGAALSKVITKITLPAALFSNFNSLSFDYNYLVAYIVGFATNVIVIILVILFTKKTQPAKRGFLIINCSGYNVALCTIPFLQSFFPPEALAAVCMFDASNAIMVFGITFSIALFFSKGGGNFNPMSSIRTLFSSVPFVTYMVMFVLLFLKIRVPDGVFSVVNMAGQANPFLAMILIGILFEPKVQKDEMRDMMQVFSVRMAAAISFGLIIYFFAPLPLLFKQVLVLVVFSPILSIAPIYTEQVGYNKSVAAVINSIMLPFALVCMTILLLVMGIF